jgi:hypothetical protein
MAATSSTPKLAPPKVYTFRELEELWIYAGGNEHEAPTAAGIALAESGGHPAQVGHNTNGTVDRGLWQINSVHGALSTLDPIANARAAVKIVKDSHGWSPWVTFKSGAYLHEIPTKGGINLEKPLEPQAGLFGILEGKVPGFSPQGGTEAGLEHAVENLGPSNWAKLLITGVLLLAGAVLVVYGIMVAVRPRQSALSLPVPAV